MAAGDPAVVKEMLAALAAAQRKMLATSDYVGTVSPKSTGDPSGEATARSIYGKATRDQAESLVEEGIAVTPLPFPVAEPGRRIDRRPAA
jgi:hypothetical protein